jgi:hypothetical protein
LLVFIERRLVSKGHFCLFLVRTDLRAPPYSPFDNLIIIRGYIIDVSFIVIVAVVLLLGRAHIVAG